MATRTLVVATSVLFSVCTYVVASLVRSLNLILSLLAWYSRQLEHETISLYACWPAIQASMS